MIVPAFTAAVRAFVTILVTVDGDQAKATYETSDAAASQAGQPWIDENGWRWDAC